jgi:PIN domain nuclease of toxin-antitoxin system
LSAVVADTHVLVWFLLEPARLSASADAALDGAVSSGIYISAITIVELVYLVEKGRLPAAVLDRLMADLAAPASAIRVAPVGLETARALSRVSRTDVPDMPDRIIAATALELGLPLVSRDCQIRASDVETIW